MVVSAMNIIHVHIQTFLNNTVRQVMHFLKLCIHINFYVYAQKYAQNKPFPKFNFIFSNIPSKFLVWYKLLFLLPPFTESRERVLHLVL